MGIGKTGELPTEEVVHREHRAFFQMQNLASNAIGVDHAVASLNEDVTGQSFEE
jgi:hypothetical protein